MSQTVQMKMFYNCLMIKLIFFPSEGVMIDSMFLGLKHLASVFIKYLILKQL